MATLRAEETRRFTSAELAAMRACGAISPSEPVELRDGRLTVDGRLRPIMPDEAILLVESGIVDERVELIDGELWIVSPQTHPHALVIEKLNRILVNAYAEPAGIRLQLPARVLGPSLPEPDLAVRRPRPALDHPGADDLALVVEVTVTSVYRDRRKAQLYSEAGVSELWLIDVEGRAITICTEPRPDGTWGSRRRVGEDEMLALPESAGSLTLRQVLPPP